MDQYTASIDVWLLLFYLNGFIVALLIFLDLTPWGQSEKVKDWFLGVWVYVEDTKWNILPERLIKLTIEKLNKLFESLLNLSNNNCFIDIAVVGLILISLVGSWMVWGIKGLLIPLVPPAIYTILKRTTKLRILNKKSKFNKLYSCIMLCGAFFFYFQIILRIDLHIAPLVSIALIPTIALGGFLVFLNLTTDSSTETFKRGRYFLKLSMLIAGISIAYTLLALTIGNILDPSAHVPRTTQLLISNLVFDELAFEVTVILLVWAASKDTLLRIPWVIFVDVISAALFAYLSLYLGLAGSQNALTDANVWNIFKGFDSTGSIRSIGPYFLVMHTTFVPTLIYLGLILVSWMMKLVLVPGRWLFGQTAESKSPMKLTALLFAVFAAFCQFARTL